MPCSSTRPAEHVGRAIGTVTNEPGGIEIKAFHRAFDHALCGQHFRPPDRGSCFDINDDRVADVCPLFDNSGQRWILAIEVY